MLFKWVTLYYLVESYTKMSEEQWSAINKKLDDIGTRLTKVEESQSLVQQGGVSGVHPSVNYHDQCESHNWWPQVQVDKLFTNTAQRLRQEDYTDQEQPTQDTEEDSDDSAKGRSNSSAHVHANRVQVLAGVPPAPPGFQFQHTGPRFPVPIQQQYIPVPIYHMEPRGLAFAHTEYKSGFDAVRNSVNRVVLEEDWTAPDSRSSIAASDRELAAILARSGKFVETELKLMKEIQSVYHDKMRVAEYMDQLHVTQKAHMRYIQEEYNSLQLGGQFGSQTKSVFKQIRRNITVYMPAFVDDIKAALAVSGV